VETATIPTEARGGAKSKIIRLTVLIIAPDFRAFKGIFGAEAASYAEERDRPVYLRPRTRGFGRNPVERLMRHAKAKSDTWKLRDASGA
jgi:hypothetical protein